MRSVRSLPDDGPSAAEGAHAYQADRVVRRHRTHRRGLCRGSGDRPPGSGDATSLPGFSTAVSLSHTNSPARSPLFPGDPAFTLTTVNTVAEDGYYLQYVREGEHTGTHYSAPCHFREGKLCAEDLDAADFILPAVVIDVRAEVAADANHVVTRADLQDWEAVTARCRRERRCCCGPGATSSGDPTW